LEKNLNSHQLKELIFRKEEFAEASKLRREKELAEFKIKAKKQALKNLVHKNLKFKV